METISKVGLFTASLNEATKLVFSPLEIKDPFKSETKSTLSPVLPPSFNDK